MREIFKLFGTITVDGLESVKKGLAQIETQFNAADKALTKFGRSSVKIGTTLSEGFTAPIAAIGAGMAIAADGTAAYSESLMNLSSVTGLSLKNLQEFKHVANLTGVSFEGLVGSIARLTNKMAGIATEGGKPYEAIKKLGVSMYDSSGNIRDMNEVFPELIRKLQEIKNPTERNSTAMEIFWKSINDLGPVLNMSNEELTAMRKEAHTLGLVMSDEGVAAADAYGDQVDKLKEQFNAFWMKLAMDFIPILRDTIIPLIQTKIVPAFESFAAKVRGMIQWFRGLNPEVKNFVVGGLAFVAVVGPVAIGLGKIILLASQMQKAFVLARVAFMALSASMLANPFVAVIVGAGVMVAALYGAKKAYDDLLKSHEKFSVMTVDQAGINALTASYANLQKQLISYGSNVEKEIENNSALRTEIEKQTEAARALGFTVEGTDVQRVQALDNINSELIKTQSLTQAIKNLSKAKGGGAGGAAGKTQDELDAIAKMNQENADKLAAITENKIENANRLEAAEIAAAKKINADTLTITKRYALLREQILGEEAAARVDKYTKEKKDSDEKSKAIAESDASWSKKAFESKDDRIGALSVERTEALKIANEKGASTLAINQYYDNEILKEKEKLRNKEKSLLGGTIKDWLGAFQTIGQGISEIFSMSTDNKIAEIDNWENAERQAIERSTDSERTKQKKIERLDQEAESKRMDIKKKAAKDSKAISLFESVIGTAAAVVGALGMKPWTPFNFALAGIVGALGVAKTAMIAAQPLPFAEGGLIQGGRGGVTGLIGEGKQDELVMPMKTGVRALADRLMDTIGGALTQSPGFAFAGAGGGSGSSRSEIHWHVGTLVADDRGIKELERRQLQFRVSEQQRKGQS